MEFEITPLTAFWTNISCHFISWIMIYTVWKYVKIKDDIEACETPQRFSEQELSLAANNLKEILEKEREAAAKIMAQEKLIPKLTEEEKEQAYASVTKSAQPPTPEPANAKRYMRRLDLMGMDTMEGYKLNTSVIKSLLKKNELNYNDLGDMVGIVPNTLYSWIQGYCSPRTQIVHRISALFETPIEKLVYKVKKDAPHAAK